MEKIVIPANFDDLKSFSDNIVIQVGNVSYEVHLNGIDLKVSAGDKIGTLQLYYHLLRERTQENMNESFEFEQKENK